MTETEVNGSYWPLSGEFISEDQKEDKWHSREPRDIQLLNPRPPLGLGVEPQCFLSTNQTVSTMASLKFYKMLEIGTERLVRGLFICSLPHQESPLCFCYFFFFIAVWDKKKKQTNSVENHAVVVKAMYQIIFLTWALGWADKNLVVKGQGHFDMTKQAFSNNWHIHTLIMTTFHMNVQ